MMRLATPVVAVVLGEGGSGGAVAFATANRLVMLEHSIYSVISPEGCASILWKTSERASDAAEALGITAHRLKALGMIDKVVSEPVGGAHSDHATTANNLRDSLVRNLEELRRLKPDKLVRRRREKFLRMGQFTE